MPGDLTGAGAPEPRIVSTKLATLDGVRELTEHESVELWLNPLGRVVVRAFNECGNNHTDVDLIDLLNWVRRGVRNLPEQGSPLYPLLNEINAAVTHGAPFLAIAMTVALPDICVSLISPDGRTNGERYRAWCEENLGKQFDFITGDDLWSMRCGVLHNGRFGDLKHNVGRVIFALPGAGTFVNCQMNDAYFYSAVDFCKNFTEAVYLWMEKNKENETVKANMPRLMQYRAGGLAPYIDGATVLA